jgi:hypothetical protein
LVRMTEGGKALTLATRVIRDRDNAARASALAQGELGRPTVPLGPASLHGGDMFFRQHRLAHDQVRRRSLKAIASAGYHAMAEVVTETADGQEKQQLWYVNEHSVSNEVLGEGEGRIAVLAWTHPGVQIALTAPLGKIRDLVTAGYRLVSVEALARAKLDVAIPDISGLYEPGGAVRHQEPPQLGTGLKAVKLDMTLDQVNAFISRMDGMMVVTGAPGSGKTTVAFQRIRFLLDQQGERRNAGRLASYTIDRTHVFLANPNLISSSRRMLVEQLDIPETAVALIRPFVEHYLDQAWRFKNDARPRQRRLTAVETSARQAHFGLAEATELELLWQAYERQIAGRLSDAAEADWLRQPARNTAARDLAAALQLAGSTWTPQRDPLRSQVTMGALYQNVSVAYLRVRAELSRPDRERFDGAFLRWLFLVYDPIDALAGHFGSRLSEGATRIRRGTASRADEGEVLASMTADWQQRRQYGPEERPWLSWLLRFALPEEADAQAHFREVPCALPAGAEGDERWTHVVIDEAQDLSVAEASLLGSFVSPLWRANCFRRLSTGCLAGTWNDKRRGLPHRLTLRGWQRTRQPFSVRQKHEAEPGDRAIPASLPRDRLRRGCAIHRQRPLC